MSAPRSFLCVWPKTIQGLELFFSLYIYSAELKAKRDVLQKRLRPDPFLLSFCYNVLMVPCCEFALKSPELKFSVITSKIFHHFGPSYKLQKKTNATLEETRKHSVICDESHLLEPHILLFPISFLVSTRYISHAKNNLKHQFSSQEMRKHIPHISSSTFHYNVERTPYLCLNINHNTYFYY